METTTIYDEEDNAIEVEFSYSPAYRGRREFGAPMEPDEDECFEFNCATDADGNEVDLTQEQLDEAEQQIRDE